MTRATRARATTANAAARPSASQPEPAEPAEPAPKPKPPRKHIKLEVELSQVAVVKEEVESSDVKGGKRGSPVRANPMASPPTKAQRRGASTSAALAVSTSSKTSVKKESESDGALALVGASARHAAPRHLSRVGSTLVSSVSS